MNTFGPRAAFAQSCALKPNPTMSRRGIANQFAGTGSAETHSLASEDVNFMPAS